MSIIKHAREHPDGKPSIFPVYLTALLFPGAGQFFQRRWVAGLIVSLFFGICFVAFLIYVLQIVLAFYSLGLEFNTYETEKVMNVPTKAAGFCFLAGIGGYIAGVIDVYAAYRRRCRKWARARWKVSEEECQTCT